MVRLVISTAARVLLAGVWLVSGWLKVVDPGQTYLAVQAYDVLPPAAVSPVAAVLPMLELALGLALLAGLRTRLVAAVSAAVLVVFIAGLAQAWARGLSIDCGCFSGGGAVDADATSYPLDLARDLGFLVLAGWLLRWPATLLSLDRLRGNRPAPADAGGRG